MAASHPPHAHECASPRSMFLHGQHKILAATRRETAARPQKRTQRPLIDANESDEDGARRYVQKVEHQQFQRGGRDRASRSDTFWIN